MVFKTKEAALFTSNVEVDGVTTLNGATTHTGATTNTGAVTNSSTVLNSGAVTNSTTVQNNGAVTNATTMVTTGVATLTQLTDGFSNELAEPGTGVALTSDTALVPRKAIYTLTGFVISVTAALDYGGTKICDLPDTNLLLLGVEIDLEVVKGNASTGLEATVDLDMGVGTAVASATTLATTMIDVIEKVDLDTDSLTVQLEAHSNDQATATPPLRIADGASSALYLNCGLPVGITVDDTLTVSGTVEVYYVDVGNVA